MWAVRHALKRVVPRAISANRFFATQAPPQRETIEIGVGPFIRTALSSYAQKGRGREFDGVKSLHNLQDARKHLKQMSSMDSPVPFIFLAGPSGSGKTQTDVAFALRHRALMFMALQDEGSQRIITEMQRWSAQLFRLARVDMKSFDAEFAEPGVPLSRRYGASTLQAEFESRPSFVIGFISRLMEAFPEGFPFNSHTQDVQNPRLVEWEVEPVKLWDFWEKHKASVSDWTVILDEAPQLRERNFLDPSARDTAESLARGWVVLFVRNLLRAALIVPILSGTNTSLSNVAESAKGSGNDGIERPFAFIVRQGIGRPPHIVDRWVAELRELLRALAHAPASASRSGSAAASASSSNSVSTPASASSAPTVSNTSNTNTTALTSPDPTIGAEWNALTAFLHQAFASGNPRLVLQMLEFLKRQQNVRQQSPKSVSLSPAAASTSASVSASEWSPRSLLEAWLKDPKVRLLVDGKFVHNPLSSLAGQIAWLKLGTMSVSGTRFIDSHFALLQSNCAGLLNLSPKFPGVAVYDLAVKKSPNGFQVAFEREVRSRFPLPTQDPLLCLLALSNREEEEALRMPVPFPRKDATAVGVFEPAAGAVKESSSAFGGNGGDFTVRSAFRKLRDLTPLLDASDNAPAEHAPDLDGRALEELVAAGFALATRAGGLGGVPRVDFLRSLCTELLLDAHSPPLRFVAAAVRGSAARGTGRGVRARGRGGEAASSSGAGAALNVSGAPGAADPADRGLHEVLQDDRALDGLLASLRFPERFPLVTGPGLGPWPDAMHDVPGLFLGEFVFYPSAALPRGDGRAGVGAKWDGALIGPATKSSRRAATCASAPHPRGKPLAEEEDEDEDDDKRAQAAFEANKQLVRDRGRLDYDTPLALIECKNHKGDVTGSILAEACSKLARAAASASDSSACRLLFVVARSFSEIDLAPTQLKGLHVDVLHLRARSNPDSKSLARSHSSPQGQRTDIDGHKRVGVDVEVSLQRFPRRAASPRRAARAASSAGSRASAASTATASTLVLIELGEELVMRR